MSNGPRIVPHHMAAPRAEYPQQPPLPVMSTSISAKQIIEGIDHAVTRSQRFYAIQTALQAFHHNNEQMHNYEVDLGAANALCIKLGYVLLQNGMVQNGNHHHNNNNKISTTTTSNYKEECELYTEISMLCSALRMVYGCSLETRVRSFQEIGQSDLFRLLVWILRISVRHNYISHHQQHARHEAIHRTLQVLRVFARLDVATKQFMMDYGDRCLLDALVQVLRSFPLEETTTTAVSEQSIGVDSQQQHHPSVSQVREAVVQIRIEAIGVIKDLSFRRTDFSDGQVEIFANNVVPTIMSFCLAKPDEEADNNMDEDTEGFRLRETSSAVLWNLALSKEISMKMAQRPEVIAILIQLTTDENAKTRRNAMSVLGNLATVVENQEALLAYEDGALLRALMKATQEDDDNDSRRRAMRTIRCLSSAHSDSLLFQQRDFVEYLIHVVANDSDPDTRIQACDTMGYVASASKVRPHMGKGLIYIIETGNDRKLMLAAFRALLQCMLSNATTEEAPTYHYEPEFFKNLEIVVKRSYDSMAQSSLARLLLLLEQDEEARKHMACDAVLDALATLLSQVDPDFESSRTDALEVVTRLVALETHKRPIAKHEPLLTALVNYALSASEGEKKDAAKDAIQRLVPEL